MLPHPDSAVARWGGSAPRAAWAALVLVVVAAASGCATYTDSLARASLAAAGGDYPSAVGAVNQVIGVGSADQLPDRWGGSRALAVLERGVLQQALAAYDVSARDLSAAEQELELLDLKLDPVGTLGSYLYSDSVKTYKTPPTERLAVNAVNLLNYLARGDLDGAAVEARRFQVMRDYLDSQGIEAAGPATLGTYLAGFVFEQRGEGDRALRYYEEAMARGTLRSLAAPVARLAPHNPYRGPRLREILKQGEGARPAGGEILVVLSVGRVPHREPRRIPIGAAIGIAGSVLTGDIDPLKYGATKVIVYPELVNTPSTLGSPEVHVDGRVVELEQLTDLGAAIRAEYEEAKPAIIAAALTRLAARAAVAEGIRAGVRKEDQLLADVLSSVVEAGMVALDRPDTRSWTMLADRVVVARLPVSPGFHQVEVHFGGVTKHIEPLQVPEGGYAAVVVTEPR